MNKVDWVKGRAFTSFRFELPEGYAINITVAQHQSGKVKVRQVVSKCIGSFNDLFKGTLDLDTSFMDKLNKLLLRTKTV